MNNTTYDSSSLDYDKPKLITNADFVLVPLLPKSPSCAPSYTAKKIKLLIQSGLQPLCYNRKCCSHPFFWLSSAISELEYEKWCQAKKEKGVICEDSAGSSNSALKLKFVKYILVGVGVRLNIRSIKNIPSFNLRQCQKYEHKHNLSNNA